MPNPDVLIGLAEAAVRLKRPYQDVHRLLCTGVLSIRVVPPDDPDLPVLPSVCTPMIGQTLC